MIGAHLVLVILAVTANIGIGTFVLAFQKNRVTNQIFFIHTLIASAWTTANYLSLHQATSAGTLLYARVEISIATIYAFTTFLTIRNFPGKTLYIQIHKLFFLLAPVIVIAILSQTNYIFSSVEGTGTAVQITAGKLIPLYGLVNAGFMIATFYSLISRIRKSKGIRKAQLNFLLAAVTLSTFTAFITNFVLVNILKFTSLLAVSPYLSLFFVFITAYAIITQHLFDIRPIISRTLIYTGLLSVILGTFAIVTLVFAQLTTNRLSDLQSHMLSGATAVILLAFVYEPVHQWLAEKTDSWLFQKEYSQLEMTHHLSAKLADVIGLDEGLQAVLQTLSQALHLSHGAAYVFNSSDVSGNQVKRSISFGYGELSNSRLQLTKEDGLVSYLQTHHSTINVDDLKQEIDEEEEYISREAAPLEKIGPVFLRQHAIKKQIVKKLSLIGADIAVPLVIKQVEKAKGD